MGAIVEEAGQIKTHPTCQEERPPTIGPQTDAQTRIHQQDAAHRQRGQVQNVHPQELTPELIQVL